MEEMKPEIVLVYTWCPDQPAGDVGDLTFAAGDLILARFTHITMDKADCLTGMVEHNIRHLRRVIRRLTGCSIKITAVREVVESLSTQLARYRAARAAGESTEGILPTEPRPVPRWWLCC